MHFAPVWYDARVPRRALFSELAFGALTLLLLVPIWSVRYPPFQDFPQYVALARTLADYRDPALAFSKYFTLNFDTYVLFAPWLSALLGWIFDPLVASKLVVSLAIVGTPWGLRVLLRAIGRPVEYAGFALPLAYNAHVVMGFVSYVVGVALMLWCLAFSALLLAEPQRRRWKIALGITSVLCLYSHVVPWAFSIGGFALAALWATPFRRLPVLVLPLAPALLLSVRGFLQSATGWNTLMVGMANPLPNCPIYDPTRVVFEQIPAWINDVFTAQWDEQLLIGLFLLGMLIMLRGTSVTPREPEVGTESTTTERIRIAFAVLAPLGFGLYFLMPRTCDWIWPIHARFLFIGVMLSALVLPPASRRLRRGLALGFAAISILVTVRSTQEFRSFESELGDFRQALAQIPQGKKVAALTVQKSASAIKLAGFHHFGAYCQAERGGLTMFSFATMPHWPIQIRPGVAPVPSFQFQFDPAAATLEDVTWAEYALVRGAPPIAVAFAFTPVYTGTHWQVLARRTAPAANKTPSEALQRAMHLREASPSNPPAAVAPAASADSSRTP